MIRKPVLGAEERERLRGLLASDSWTLVGKLLETVKNEAILACKCAPSDQRFHQGRIYALEDFESLLLRESAKPPLEEVSETPFFIPRAGSVAGDY